MSSCQCAPIRQQAASCASLGQARPPASASPRLQRPPACASSLRGSGARSATASAAGDGAASVTTAPPAFPAAGGADAWAAFADNVSGEWDGVTASFNGADGEPLQLPEYYVPDAFRQWGVELHDWQSQCSVKADAAGVEATTRRMMPTVGCEADAIAFTSDARRLLDADPCSAAAPPTVAADGAYSAGPTDVSAADAAAATFEACLVLAPRGRRLRLVHNLARRGASVGWRLDDVEVHNERYDGPHNGRVELTGCGGGMTPFATGARLPADALAGAWTAAGVRYTCGGAGGCRAEAVAGEAWSAAGLPAVLLHPLSAWSSCAVSGEGGNDISLAAGVLLEGGDSMAVVTRRMQGGRLAAVELLTLSRAS